MNTCAAPMCGAEIADRLFCCARHWWKIPELYRDQLADAYYNLKKELVSLEDVRLVKAETCDSLGWERPIDLITAGASISKTVCRKCGTASLSVFRDDGGRIAVDELKASRKAAAAASGEALVVVAFFALPASACKGSYALFAEHKCGAPHA